MIRSSSNPEYNPTVGPQNDRGGVMLTTNLGLKSLTTANGDPIGTLSGVFVLE